MLRKLQLSISLSIRGWYDLDSLEEMKPRNQPMCAAFRLSSSRLSLLLILIALPQATKAAPGDLVITNVAINPNSVNTSLSPITVAITITTTNAAGLALLSCNPTFASPAPSLGVNVNNGAATLLSSSLVAAPSNNSTGTTQAPSLVSVYQVLRIFPMFTPRGFWNITSVACYDSSYTYAYQYNVGGVNQVGLGQTALPQIRALSVSPSTVDTSASAATVTVQLVASDSPSGISSCSVTMRSDTVGLRKNFYPSMALSAGTIFNGTWVGTFVVPAMLPACAIVVWSASCSNFAGFQGVSVSSSAANVTQTGRGDQQAPNITTLSLSATAVDVTAGSATLTLTVGYADDASGLNYCAVNYGSASRSFTSSGAAYTSASFGIGAPLSGTLAVPLTVGQYAVVGTWAVFAVSCYDKVDRSSTIGAASGAAWYSSSANAVLAGRGGVAVVFNVTSVVDAQAPTVSGFMLSPSTVSTGLGPATVSGQWVASDDVSGVASCTCTVTGPDRSLNTYYMSTSPSAGLVGTLTLPRFSPAGLYNVTQLQCTDVAQKSTSFSGNTMPANSNAFRTWFVQTAAGDMAAPAILAVGVSPSVVDTSAAPVLVTVWLNVSDDVSGLLRCDLQLAPPAGSADAIVYASTSTYGATVVLQAQTITASMTLPQFSSMGTWRLSSIVCRDNFGRSTSISSADFAWLGLGQGGAASVNQVGAQDQAGPVIVSFSVSTARFNTSAAAGLVGFVWGFQDDASGVVSCGVQVVRADGSVYMSMSGSVSPASTGGLVSVSSSVARGTVGGNYTVSQISCTDATSKVTTLRQGQFASVLGSAWYGFVVTSAGDTQPPVISGVQVTPAAVSTGSGSAAVTVWANVSDDVSGLQLCYFYFNSPTAASAYSCRAPAGTFDYGEMVSGTVSCSITLVQYSPNGTYTLSSVACYDNVNRYTTYTPPTPISFQQVSSSTDSLLPLVVNASVSPAVVRTYAAGATVVGWWQFSDDVAGVSSCRMSFLQPDGSTMSLAASVSVASVRGTMSTSMQLGQFSPQGVYIATECSCQDATGKTGQLPASLLSQLTFEQADTGDAFPPTIVGVGFSPANVDCSTAGQTVTANITVGDDVSGVRQCTVSVQSPLGGASSAGSQLTAGCTAFVASATQVTRTASIQCALTLPQYASSGVWTWTSIVCYDFVWRSSNMAPVGSLAPGRAFNVTSFGDTSPPTILNVSLAVTQVNTSLTAASIPVSVQYRDDVSGVVTCVVSVSTPLGSSSSYSSTLDPSLSRGSSATGIILISLARYSLQGTYTLAQVSCTDGTGRSSTVSSGSFLAQFGVSSLTFVQVAPGDMSPPQLLGYFLSPQVIDSQSSPASTAVYLNLSDDGSGLQFCYVTICAPASVQCRTCSVDGTGLPGQPFVSGIVACPFSFPRFSVFGNWTLSSGYCVDRFGRRNNFATSDFVRLGSTSSNASYLLQSGLGDSTPPVINNVSVSPAMVNTTLSSPSVTITFNVSDNYSGVASCTAFLSPPSGSPDSRLYCSTPSLSPFSTSNVILQCSVAMNLFSASGKWSVTDISCYDSASNANNDLSFAPDVSPFFITQIGLGDRQPPVIRSFSLSPSIVNTNLGPATITMNIGFSDDAAGTSTCFARFLNPLSNSITANGYSASQLSSGTILNGTMTFTYVLPRLSPQGSYTLSSLNCQDVSSKSTNLAQAQFSSLATGSGPFAFNQTGAGDSSPPVVLGYELKPSVINTTSASAQVVVSINASDDAGGLQYCYFYLRPSVSGSSVGCYAPPPSSSTLLHGVLQCTLQFDAYRGSLGSWTLDTFYCGDNTGKTGYYSISSLQALGISTPGVLQVGAVDMSPPVIFNFSISPRSVSTLASPATLRFTWLTSDEMSGVRYCVVFMNNPTLTIPYTISSNSLSVGGSTFNLSFTATFSLAQYSLMGSYNVTRIGCVDFSGKWIYFEAAEMAARGWPTSFVQTAPADNLAPVIYAVSLAPTTIDTSAQAVSVVATFNVSDDVAGIATCSFSMASPAGSSSSLSCSTPSFGVGVMMSGILTCSLSFSQYSAMGVWTVSSVSCRDNTNKATTLMGNDVSSAFSGLAGGVSQTGVPDLLGPSITGLSVSSAVINTSAASAAVVVTWVFGDDVAGVQFCTARFLMPDGSSTVSVSAYWTSASQRSGSATSGSMGGLLTFNAYSARGLYSLNQMSCTDNAGRTTSVASGQLASVLQVSTVPGIQQVGVGDAAGPVIGGVQVSPSQVDTGRGAGVPVVLAINVSDDVSGVSSCTAVFSPPAGSADSSVSCYTPSYAAQVVLQGTVPCTATIPAYAAVGNWTLSSVACTDVMGRRTTKNARDFVAANQAVAVVLQVGLADVQAPTVTSFSVSPSSVNTSMAGAAVVFTFGFADDASGLSSCFASVQGPGGAGGFSAYAYASNGLVAAGNSTAGSVSVSYSLARFSVAGNYTVSTVACTDVSQKTRTLTRAQVVALAPTSNWFTQVASGDSAAPRVSSVMFSPLTVDCSGSDATITAAVNVSDDVSGVQRCTLYLLPPLGSGDSGLSCSTATMAAGVLSSGRVQCAMIMPRYAARGVWSLNYVSCTDVAGRWAYVYPGDLASSGAPVRGIQQVGVADLGPPVMANFSIGPAVVNTSTGSATLALVWMAWDDVSGVGQCMATVSRPDGTTFSIFASTGVVPVAAGGAGGNGTSGSGSVLGVLYSIAVSYALPQHSMAGAFSVTQVGCMDRMAKWGYAYAAQFSGLFGVSAGSYGFAQVAAGDMAAPVVRSFSYSPSVVYVTGSVTPINFTISYADDVSGLNFCTVRFRVGNSGGFSFSSYYSSAVSSGLATGSSQSGTMVFRFSYNPSAVANLTLTVLTCYDRFGRTGDFSSLASLRSLGLALDGVAPGIRVLNLSALALPEGSGIGSPAASSGSSDDALVIGVGVAVPLVVLLLALLLAVVLVRRRQSRPRVRDQSGQRAKALMGSESQRTFMEDTEAVKRQALKDAGSVEGQSPLASSNEPSVQNTSRVDDGLGTFSDVDGEYGFENPESSDMMYSEPEGTSFQPSKARSIVANSGGSVSAAGSASGGAAEQYNVLAIASTNTADNIYYSPSFQQSHVPGRSRILDAIFTRTGSGKQAGRSTGAGAQVAQDNAYYSSAEGAHESDIYYSTIGGGGGLNGAASNGGTYAAMPMASGGGYNTLTTEAAYALAIPLENGGKASYNVLTNSMVYSPVPLSGGSYYGTPEQPAYSARDTRPTVGRTSEGDAAYEYADVPSRDQIVLASTRV